LDILNLLVLLLHCEYETNGKDNGMPVGKVGCQGRGQSRKNGDQCKTIKSGLKSERKDACREDGGLAGIKPVEKRD
jgi:hypothetical protein